MHLDTQRAILATAVHYLYLQHAPELAMASLQLLPTSSSPAQLLTATAAYLLGEYPQSLHLTEKINDVRAMFLRARTFLALAQFHQAVVSCQSVLALLASSSPVSDDENTLLQLIPLPDQALVHYTLAQAIQGLAVATPGDEHGVRRAKDLSSQSHHAFMDTLKHCPFLFEAVFPSLAEIGILATDLPAWTDENINLDHLVQKCAVLGDMLNKENALLAIETIHRRFQLWMKAVLPTTPPPSHQIHSTHISNNAENVDDTESILLCKECKSKLPQNQDVTNTSTFRAENDNVGTKIPLRQKRENISTFLAHQNSTSSTSSSSSAATTDRPTLLQKPVIIRPTQRQAAVTAATSLHQQLSVAKRRKVAPQAHAGVVPEQRPSCMVTTKLRTKPSGIPPPPQIRNAAANKTSSVRVTNASTKNEATFNTRGASKIPVIIGNRSEIVKQTRFQYAGNSISKKPLKRIHPEDDEDAGEEDVETNARRRSRSLSSHQSVSNSMNAMRQERAQDLKVLLN